MTVIKLIILEKDCGGVISHKEDTNTRFYLRKQRNCFLKAKDAASFLRPSGCTNCENLFGGSFVAEVCIETTIPFDINIPFEQYIFYLDNLVNLETENVCPYEVSSTIFEISKDRCKRFLSRKKPHFKITTILNGPQVSRNVSQNENIFVKL